MNENKNKKYKKNSKKNSDSYYKNNKINNNKFKINKNYIDDDLSDENNIENNIINNKIILINDNYPSYENVFDLYSDTEIGLYNPEIIPEPIINNIDDDNMTNDKQIINSKNCLYEYIYNELIEISKNKKYLQEKCKNFNFLSKENKNYLYKKGFIDKQI